MYDIGQYFQASSVGEALDLLAEHPQARIICGGSDVLIRIREGRMAGASLIGIREIPKLHGVILEENGDVRIGAATTFSHLMNNEIIKNRIPVLGCAVGQVGGPQIRNIGTIGGNVCNGAVSADSAPALFSLNALLHIQSREGSRTASIHDFYLGPGKVDLHPGELLTDIVIPAKEYQGFGGHYIKYAMRDAMDIANISCCALVRIGGGGILEDVRLTFGVAAPVPYRCRKTEEALIGRPAGEELWKEAGSLVRTEISPRDSWRASREFRVHIAGEIAERALREAAGVPGGECL